MKDLRIGVVADVATGMAESIREGMSPNYVPQLPVMGSERWSDVDFAKRLVHVHGGTPGAKRIRRGPGACDRSP